MNKLLFRVEQAGSGYVRLQVVGRHTHAPDYFSGPPHGKLELWNVSPVLSSIPVGTEIEINWPAIGQNESESEES